MQTVKYAHWQDGGWWPGYLQDDPDDWTQGETRDDLIEHLKDLYLDLHGGSSFGLGRVAASVGEARRESAAGGCQPITPAELVRVARS
jgi:hypothetical protein